VIMTFADGSRIRHTVGPAQNIQNAVVYLLNQDSFVDAAADKIYLRTGLVSIEKAEPTAASAG